MPIDQSRESEGISNFTVSQIDPSKSSRSFWIRLVGEEVPFHTAAFILASLFSLVAFSLFGPASFGIGLILLGGPFLLIGEFVDSKILITAGWVLGLIGGLN